MNAVSTEAATLGRYECPLCAGAARPAFIASDLNRQATEQSFAYARCRSCGAYFLIDAPGDMSGYYASDYYALPPAESLDDLARSERIYVQMLLDHTRPGRLVEIGPGSGVFARAAQNAGFDVTAIEMDSRVCDYLRTVVGVEAINSSVPEQILSSLPPSQAIVLWQVIEHLASPMDVIERAADNLDSGGVLAIATPNPEALQFKLMRRRWAHLDAPRHQFLIPQQMLARRCWQCGLRLVHTTTSDPAGRHWNRFGWEYALRRTPRSHPGTRARTAIAGLIARMLAPVETRGAKGCCYTSIFIKTSTQ